MHFLNEIEGRHCPEYLNALIHEHFVEDGHSVPMTYDWCRPSPGMPGWAPAPDELWLIAKDRRYGFDLRAGYGGFIVSAELLEPILAASDGWHVSTLHVVNGRNEPITDRDYRFIQPSAALDLPDPIDRERSAFSVGFMDGIDEVSELVLTGAVASREVAVCLGEPILWPFVFVSDRLAATLSGREWAGVEVLPVADFRRDLRF